MSGMFQEIEGETAIIAVGGVYKEAQLYKRNHGELYAKAFGGFIRLKFDGATSKSGARLDTITIDTLCRDKMGNLCTTMAPDRVELVREKLHYLPHIQEEE